MIKHILALCMILILSVVGVSANIYSENEYTSANGFEGFINSVYSTIDYDNLNKVLTIQTDSNQQHPTVCDIAGQVRKQLHTYKDHRVNSYFIEGESLVLRSIFELENPDDNIIDISCITNIQDSQNRRGLQVIYETDDEIKIEIYMLFFSTSIDEYLLQKISTLATFPKANLITEVTCSEFNLGSVKHFRCSAGFDNSGEHIIYKWGSSSTYTHIVKVPGLKLVPDASVMSSGQIHNFGRPQAVVDSYGTNYDLIVTNHNASWSTITGHSVLSINTRSCASDMNCTIPSFDITAHQITDQTTEGATNKKWIISNPTKLIQGPMLNAVNCMVVAEKSGQEYVGLSNANNGRGFTRIKTICNDIVDRTEYLGTLIPSSTTGSANPIYSSLPLSFIPYQETAELLICTDSATNMYQGGFGGAPTMAIRCMGYDFDSPTNNVYTIKAQYHYTSAGPEFLVGQLNNQDVLTLVLHRGSYKTLVPGVPGTYSTTDLDFISTPGLSTIYQSDINLDGVGEFILMGEDQIKIYYGFLLTPEQIILPADEFNDGTFGYCSVHKQNSIARITAQQCIDGQITACNYISTNPDPFVQERLCTTLVNGTYACGPWSSIKPFIDVNLTTLGNQNFQVDMYSARFPELVLNTMDVTIQVTEDAPECKQFSQNWLEAYEIVQWEDDFVPPGTVTPPPPGDSYFQESIFQELQNHGKTLFGLAIIIGLLATLAAQGIRNPVVLMFIGILGTVAMTVIGVISGTVLVFILITAVIMIVLSQTVFKAQE